MNDVIDLTTIRKKRADTKAEKAAADMENRLADEQKWIGVDTLTILCARCKGYKSVENFNKSSSNLRGYHSYCKACLAAYHEVNKEKVSSRQKIYRAANKASIAQAHSEYREKNKEKIREYYQVNREKIAKRAREYMARRKESDAFYASSQRLRLLVYRTFTRTGRKKDSRTTSLLGCSVKEVLAKWGVEKIPKGYHIDHICPISQATTASEAESLCHYTNLQLLPGKENLSKGNHWTERGSQLCRELLGREWIESKQDRLIFGLNQEINHVCGTVNPQIVVAALSSQLGRLINSLDPHISTDLLDKSLATVEIFARRPTDGGK